MRYEILTFCYIGDHKIDDRSRLKLPPQVLSTLKTSNDHNVESGEFRLERKEVSLEITFRDIIKLVFPNFAANLNSFSIDDLVYLSPGVIESQTPVFNAGKSDLVFLYSMTDAINIIYPNHPMAERKKQNGTSKPACFRLAHIDSQHRILLKPFEVAIAEGPERYTRIEGYQPLSCFTLRKSDYTNGGNGHAMQ